MRLRMLLPVLAFVVLTAACTRVSDGLGLVRVDRPLPGLTGSTVGGGPLDATDYSGQVLVVNFWATWCGPCREEQPALQQVWRDYQGRGVQFVGVNYRDDAAAAGAWIDEFGVTYPSIQDRSGGWADDFGFLGLPDTYVADAGGTIRYLITGPTTSEQLSGVLDELLASPAPS
ncbi:MAG: TlpA family protein disulfide reductase [Actinomycetota bacterium]|nr:TlpA family protein disulfide reductase [Actinomycetota bacterium]